MTILSTFGGTSGVDTGDIGHSLRFRGRPATPYLNKTFGSPTTQNGWAFSCWVKFSELPNGSNYRPLLAAGTVAGGTWPGETLFCYPDGTLAYYAASVSGTHNVAKRSSQVLRDPTAWVHIFVRKTAAANSGLTFVRMWVNNIEVTSWSNNAYTGTQASVPDYVNVNATAHRLGMNFSGEYLDGYISRVCFVDNGSSLLPTDFAYLNTEINEWVTKTQSQVKAVVDAGGTNSFMLDFDDATSLTTLGYDKSSKGNNWTLNNFSLTAGPNYDHMLDVPGNSYATLNPLGAILNRSLLALSEGNIKASGTSAVDRYAESTLRFGTTPCVAEATLTSHTSGNPSFGVLNDTGTYGMSYFSGGEIYVNGGFTTPGATYAAGDTIRIEVNPVTLAVEIFKNGTSVRQLTLTGTPTVFQAYSSNVATWVVNHGQAPLHASATYHSAAGGYFRDAPTTGFLALCQANLPSPAILNPSSAVAHRFEAGSGIAASIASDRSGWSDWMEWFKRTDTTESWKVRFSDDSGNMLAFDTNGAKAAWSAPSTGTYLGAAFKVGATYGVVTGTYSGDSTSNKNISHSLGKVPTCGIVKNESTGTWYVWHMKMTSAAYFTTLNSATPPAQSNTNTPWGTGNWSSTQFMVTNNATNNLNATGSTYRYILFADIDGLLALLGHTGNASTDGAFESSGHKSQLLIQKDLSATTGFYVWSDKIDTYNVTASYLLLNTNAGTAAATGVDVCSNGTKYRSATIANAANPHMGISYSRTAGKYSLAR